MEPRVKWNIFPVLNKKNCQPRILYSVKVAFRDEDGNGRKENKEDLSSAELLLKKWLKEAEKRRNLRISGRKKE